VAKSLVANDEAFPHAKRLLLTACCQECGNAEGESCKVQAAFSPSPTNKNSPLMWAGFIGAYLNSTSTKSSASKMISEL